MLGIATDPFPLRIDSGGAVRVGRTRVRLDTVIYAYTHGRTPEEIVESFDSLDLADVFTVIGYYLRHRAEVDAFLEENQREAEELHKQMEALFPSEGIRERLLARRAASKPAP